MTIPQALYGGGVLLSGLLAIFLGGPLTLWVFRHVEQRERRPQSARGADQAILGITAAAVVLRGGSAIGQLERAAVYLGLVVGWPEAIAAVIALKGLGRFAELRGATDGAAERFMIGSFTSLLWASLLGTVGRACVEGYVTSGAGG